MTSVNMILENRTELPLTLVDAPQPHGRWSWPPPARIEPGGTPTMRLISTGLLEGCEGRVTYRIGDDPTATVYLHAENPYLGSNGFHSHTDGGHYASWWASGSTHAKVTFTLQPRGEVATDFLPSRDGFKFGNSWPETPYALPFLRNTPFAQKYGDAGMGLCGGMVFAALDYFWTGQVIPPRTDAPPGEQDPLFLYLVDRLFDSFDPATVTLMLSLMSEAYPDSDEEVLSRLGLASGRAAVMAHQEWPLIKRDIDTGVPSPMFIQTVKSTNPAHLGECHQVLAYAYDVSGHDIKLRIYDPNSEMSDGVTLAFNDATAAEPIHVVHNIDVTDDDGAPRQVFCFVRMVYGVAQPKVPTSRRMSALERARRRVSVQGEPPVRTSGATSRSGVESFEILPDCGTAQLTYTIVEETSEHTLRARPVGFSQPLLAWSVGGTTLADGETRDVTLPAVNTYVIGRPAEEESGPEKLTSWGERELRAIVVRASVGGDTLHLINRSEDGNYALPVSVSCREREEDDLGVSSALALEVTGWRAEVAGLEEANGACFRAYVNARREGPPDLRAGVEQLLAQLGRPGNPLWDPDPALARVTMEAVASDPRPAEARADVAGMHELITTRFALLDAIKSVEVDRPPIERPPIERPPIDRPPFDIPLDLPG
ncbi:MAG: hypothetical protein IPL60_06510 [Ardenticatenia bacterium]|nr:hypothetical protein [Ardenticatenia bacterium]